MERQKLPWLIPAPVDLRARLKTVESLTREAADTLCLLANTAMDANQLNSLYNCIKRMPKENVPGNLKQVKLAVLSNATTKLMMPSLVATGLRYRLLIEEVPCEYDQVVQQAIDANAPLHNADIILLALDARGIPGLSQDFSDNGEAAVASAINYVCSVRDALKKHSKAQLVFQTVVKSNAALFGSFDAQVPGSQLSRIQSFNVQLADMCRANKDMLLDVASLAFSLGLDHWHDDVQWHNAKLPFSQNCMPIYADHAMRLIAAAKGRLRKCLVLDLDNTLWGGVIGDDGLEGIAIGQGSALGEAYLAIQRMALELRARGIILAVCSKNNEDVARKPFQSHPDMLLKEEHIAVFIANWKDKATNLEAIASALNIGLDSLVFLDDNPVERQQVREALPMVAVPEVSADAALYPHCVWAAGYFETVTFSEEDKSRAEQYRANAMRALAESSHRNLDEFLTSLNMDIEFAPFDAIGRARIAQLIARSNQFNLTTKRYGEADVEAFERKSHTLTLQIRLRDKFGDNGMISVLICEKQGKDLVIDTWLMSCRVLNRRVEDAVLDELVAHARAVHAEKLVGHYIPTDRNELVKEHYQKLGFTLASEENGTTKWYLEVAGYSFRNPPMNVLRKQKESQAA